MTFTAGTVTPATTGDIVAGFSARGPALGSPSILKPDVLAPGVDIIVAQTPDVPAGAGALFDYTQPGNLFRPAGRHVALGRPTSPAPPPCSSPSIPTSARAR